MAHGETYFDFVDKFAKKTKRAVSTDECYTPPAYMEAVDQFCREKGWIDFNTKIVRPFKPDGDYEHEEYPEGCAVIDNPPFSIVAQIVRFYVARGIKFFLFCDGKTVISTAQGIACSVVSNSTITYHNGAQVNTGFVTNMTSSQWMSSPRLSSLLLEAKGITEGGKKRANATAVKVVYPRGLITFTQLRRACVNGWEMEGGGCEICSNGSEVFGDGLLAKYEDWDKLEECGRSVNVAAPGFSFGGLKGKPTTRMIELCPQDAVALRRLNADEQQDD